MTPRDVEELKEVLHQGAVMEMVISLPGLMVWRDAGLKKCFIRGLC